MPILTADRRSQLRAKAHHLSPVVFIGDKGLTETVVAEIGRALQAHELIKVKAAVDDRKLRTAWLNDICARLDAQAVQSIGKILVIWRENPDKAAAPVAKPSPKAAPKRKKATAAGRQAKKHRTAEELIRIERPRSRTPSPPPASAPRRRRPRTSR